MNSILNIYIWVGLHTFASSVMMFKVIDLIVDVRVIKSWKDLLKATDTQIVTAQLNLNSTQLN